MEFIIINGINHMILLLFGEVLLRSFYLSSVGFYKSFQIKGEIISLDIFLSTGARALQAQQKLETKSVTQKL